MIPDLRRDQPRSDQAALAIPAPSMGTVTHVTALAKTRVPESVSAARLRGAVLLGLIAVLVAVRTAISLSGYLVGDDFAVRYRAAVQDWTLAYAFEPYNDHVSPIGYTLQWILQALFAGSHIALVLCTSMLMIATLLFLSGFMWVITERSASVVLVCVIVGLGLFTFEVATWWTVSLYSMTYLAFTSLALWGLVRRLRWGSGVWQLVAGLLGALLSDSKGFFVLILLFGVTAGLAVTPDGPLGVVAAWRRLRGVWLTGLASAAALVAWSMASTSGVQGDPTVTRALRMFVDLWVVNIAPAVFGGPWWWYAVPTEAWSPVRVLPATPLVLGIACLGAITAGLVFVMRRRPAIAAFVPYALLYSLAATALPVLARSGTDLSSPAYRYTFDVVLPTAILTVLALVPVWWEDSRTSRATIPVTAGLVLSMAFSTASPAIAWGQNDAEDYVVNAVSGFPSIPADQPVIPQGVPEDLVPGLLWQYANTEAVLLPQPGAPDFAPTTHGDLMGFGEEGQVSLQDVIGPRSPTGPDPDCGWAVTDVPRAIPLDGGLIAWDFLARVAYFSATDTTLNLAVGGQIYTVPLPAASLDAVYFPVTGPGEEILISIGTPGTTVCVTEVRVGNRVDSATGSPVPWPPGELAP